MQRSLASAAVLLHRSGVRQRAGSYKLSPYASAYSPAAQACSMHQTARSQLACAVFPTSPATAAGRSHAGGSLQHQLNNAQAFGVSSVVGSSNFQPASCSKNHWRRNLPQSLAGSQTLPVQAGCGSALHASRFLQVLPHTAGFSVAARCLQPRHQHHPNLHQLQGLISTP